MKNSTELVSYFMAMPFEERERFLLIFKKIYDASRRAKLKETND
jgi:hypothetical protein